MVQKMMGTSDAVAILADGRMHEFVIHLNAGIVSRKYMSEYTTPSGRTRYLVLNMSDDSEQRLTLKQLDDSSYTLIGEAAKVGALYHLGAL